jgi:hypothetical protein
LAEYAVLATEYREGLRKPTFVPAQAGEALVRAINAAKSGAAALVPPQTVHRPSW